MTAIRSGQRLLVHRHFSYMGETEFLAAGVEFLTSAPPGRPLVVVAAPRSLEALRALVPAELECHQSAEWFGTPPRALAALIAAGRERWWREGHVHLLVDQAWTGRARREVREWKRHEALLNVVLAHTPTHLLCAYDAARSPGDVLSAARRTHQGDDYADPVGFVASCDNTLLASPGEPFVTRGFQHGDLPSLRRFTDEALGALGVRHTMPMLLSVDEVAANIIKHGSGAGSLCVWSDGTSAICDLVDPGFRLDDPLLGFLPPHPDRTGDAGMWAVRQLCDLVEIRSGADGTLFRLHLHLTRPP